MLPVVALAGALVRDVRAGCGSAMPFSPLWLLIILFAVPATAQFRSLAPSGDGSRLFFSSERRQAGTDQPFHPKVFELSSTGALRLVASEPFSPIGNSGYSIVPYRYTSVAISDDAAVQLLTLERYCGDGLCLRAGQGPTILRNGTEERFPGGPCSASRNGRFVACYRWHFNGRFTDWSSFLDLQTRASRNTPDRITITSRPADNGTVCLSDGRVQDTEGRVATLDLPGPVKCLDLDAAAAIFAVVSEGRTWILDSRTGRAVPLGTAVEVPRVRLSADGRTAVYTINDYLAAWSAETGQTRVYETPWTIQDIALASVAPIVWATTADGRIIRVDLQTGVVQDLTRPTPVAIPPKKFPVGSSVIFRAAQGSTLDGLTVRLDGSPADLFEVRRTPGELTVQIPWESPAGVSLALVSAGRQASLFDPGFTFPGETMAVRDTRGGFIFPTAYHQDWRGPVTEADPALPGEYVNFYAIGLGAVTPAVATGEPGPSNPPAVVPGFGCYGRDYKTLDTWAGLAPGLVGYYQVTVRMPEGPGPSGTQRESFGCTRDVFNVFLRRP